MRILFQGDSITDAGSYGKENTELTGYTKYVAESLGAGNDYINRGVGGNRSINILGRFYKDIYEIKPDVMVLLAGINDVCYRYIFNVYTDPGTYYESMKEIILKTRQAFPHVKIILIEPFLFPKKEVAHWRRDLSDIIEKCRELAREYADAFIPMDGIFAKTLLHEDIKNLTDDGVHPKETAQRIMAKCVVDEIKKLYKS